MYYYHLFRPYPKDYHLSIYALPLIHGHVRVVSQLFITFHCYPYYHIVPILSSQFHHSEYAQGVGCNDEGLLPFPSPYDNPVFIWI